MPIARNPIAKDSVRGLPGMLDKVCWHYRWRKVAQALTQDMAQGEGVKVVLFNVSCVHSVQHALCTVYYRILHTVCCILCVVYWVLYGVYCAHTVY